MAITAVVNRPYPNRVQLLLGTLPGPLLHVSYGTFDPRRDVDIYNGGMKMTVDSFTWDPKGNRYLIFLTEALDFNQITQVIHHMPNPPFVGESNPTLKNLALGGHPSFVSESLTIVPTAP